MNENEINKNNDKLLSNIYNDDLPNIDNQDLPFNENITNVKDLPENLNITIDELNKIEERIEANTAKLKEYKIIESYVTSFMGENYFSEKLFENNFKDLETFINDRENSKDIKNYVRQSVIIGVLKAIINHYKKYLQGKI